MLERLVVTLTATTLSVTLGGTYAWAQGAFEPSRDLGAVAQESVPALDGPSGYGAATPRPTATPSAAPARRVPPGPAPWDPVPAIDPDPGPLPVLLGAGGTSAARTAPAGTAGSPGVAAGGATPSTIGSTIGSTPGPATGPATGGTTSPPAPEPTGTPGDGDFTVASVNVLGHSHTRPGGNKPGWAPSAARMATTKKVLDSHGVDVVGFQEFEPEQRREFARLSPTWAQYPGVTAPRGAGADSVAWDTAVWQRVDARLVRIPYFHGQLKPMPYVLLQHRETGKKLWVSSFHNPADVRGRAQKWRNQATDRQVRLFNRLEATGDAQVVTGDMNERTRYFCRITRETPLVAPAGESPGPGCTAPARTGIDWLFGSPSLRFAGYEMDRGAAVRTATDHPVVVADASFGD